MKRELSIVVPALNEELHLAAMIPELLEIARQNLDAFEIILVDDGSSDRTGEIMEELAAQAPGLVVRHHETPHGVGAAFHTGIAVAAHDLLTLLPGDNAYDLSSLHDVFAAVGSADLIITYRANQSEARQRHRWLLSRLYLRCVSLLFGVPARDLHSMVVFPVPMLRRLQLDASGYAYQVQALVQLKRLGARIRADLPVRLRNRSADGKGALRFSTLWELCKTVLFLLGPGSRRKARRLARSFGTDRDLQSYSTTTTP